MKQQGGAGRGGRATQPASAAPLPMPSCPGRLLDRCSELHFTGRQPLGLEPVAACRACNSPCPRPGGSASQTSQFPSRPAPSPCFQHCVQLLPGFLLGHHCQVSHLLLLQLPRQHEQAPDAQAVQSKLVSAHISSRRGTGRIQGNARAEQDGVCCAAPCLARSSSSAGHAYSHSCTCVPGPPHSSWPTLFLLPGGLPHAPSSI